MVGQAMILSALAIPAALAGETDDGYGAVDTCRVAILVSLHDPKSAEFPGITKSYRKLAKGVWTAQVEVRARNAYNTLRLVTYECRVDAKTAKLLSIKQLR